MFCKNCGAQLPDGVKFCNSCGAAVNVTLSVPENAGNTTNNNTSVISKSTKKKFPVSFIVIIVIIVVAIILLFGNDDKDYETISGADEYEETVDNFFEGLFEADGKLFVSTFSESFIEEQMENNGYHNKAVLTEQMQNNLNSLAEAYTSEFGKNWKYSYEIIDITEYNNGVEITVSIDVSGKKAKDSEAWILTLSKEGDKWLIDDFFQ